MLFRETLSLCCYPATTATLKVSLTEMCILLVWSYKREFARDVWRFCYISLGKIAPPHSLASNIQPYAKARPKEAGACEGSRRPNAVEVWVVLKKRGQG